MKFMWIGALIASAVLSAVFLIISLAQFEAGTRAKAKWLGLTVCSLAVVAGLIYLKPRADLEKIQYMPAPPPASEKENEPKAPVKTKTVSKDTASSSGTSSGEKPKDTAVKNQEASGQARDAQGKTGVNKDSKTVPEKKPADLTIQDQLSQSLQKKGDQSGKVEFKDPVLAEIQELKRQAEEAATEEAAKESAAVEQSSDSGVSNYLLAQKGLSGMPSAQQQKDLTPDSRNEIGAAGDTGKKREQQIESQKEVKARVLVSEVNVRDRGNTEGKIVGVLQQGDVVTVIGKSDSGEWNNIRMSSGQSGWVLSKYLQSVPE